MDRYVDQLALAITKILCATTKVHITKFEVDYNVRVGGHGIVTVTGFFSEDCISGFSLNISEEQVTKIIGELKNGKEEKS